jgi:hypothetical protein
MCDRNERRAARRYLLLHPDADLTDAERRLLVEALEGMGGGDRSGPGG